MSRIGLKPWLAFSARLHFAEHHVGDLFRNVRPDGDDLVVALAVGDRAVAILLVDLHDFVLGVLHKVALARRHDQIVDADRDAGAGGVEEAEFLDVIEHRDRHLRPVTQIGEADELTETLLLQQAVDERHALRQVVEENRRGPPWC